MKSGNWHIAALYHFASIPEPAAKRAPLAAICHEHGILGTILLAHEGINGTVSAPSADALDAVIDHIKAWPEITTPLEVKTSIAGKPGFLRMKVRLKKEIVTMHRPEITADNRGEYVEPRDWNALISRDDVMVIDTRNTYETRIGGFKGATDPGTAVFGEFPFWADGLPETTKKTAPKKIAMYCTGGIRCEKASAYMKSLGFDEVYHLKGGILKYLEEIPEADSLWQGECFVFDERVSVKRSDKGKIEAGSYQLCHACKQPLSPADREHADYELGVSCPHCAGAYSEESRARFRQRQKQIDLAQQRGQVHMGAAAQKGRRK